jgi:hypothetical protein
MPCHAPNPRYRDTSCLEPEEPMALSQKLAQKSIAGAELPMVSIYAIGLSHSHRI